MAERERLFLDTSVLMYAAGAEHPLRQPCHTALRRAVDDGVPLVISAEVLQEILHRYFSIDRPDTARLVFRSARDLAAEVLPVTDADAERALEILTRRGGITPRDAIHVAVMQRAGIGRILSTDRHFDAVDGVERVDPAVVFSRGRK